MKQTLTLQISGEMVEAISLVAHSEDATAGEIIRDAIRRDLRRRVTERQEKVESDKNFEPLKKLLGADFERSRSWSHLQSRLMDKGYRLHQGTSDLMLHRISGEWICRLSDLGLDQKRLAAHFEKFAKRRMPAETIYNRAVG